MSDFYNQNQYVLEKMKSCFDENKVTYFLNQNIRLSPGMTIEIRTTGRYQCSSCGKILKKTYSGFCYVCLTQKAMADTCIMSPHRCHYLQGTCREPGWGENFCFKPHFVYLSYTDKFKVGLTRQGQIPYRWIDQGATCAAALAKVTSRYQAGVIEKSMTQILSDKSHWQKMLKSGNQKPTQEEFLSKWQEVQGWLKENLKQHPDLIVQTVPHLGLSQHVEIFDHPEVVELHYPFLTDSDMGFMEKIKSVSLEKSPVISGKILGIKGQYLIFQDGVFNVRSHEGTIVDLRLY